MDGNRFDALTRALGAGRSRRGAIKALGAAALGAAGLARLGEADAAHPTCPAPLKRCGSGAEMVCVDYLNDVDNCGHCGHVCTAGDNEVAVCRQGHCTVACAPGLANCGRAHRGCATILDTDPNNCGACGHACSGGTPDCVNGACVPACADTETRCDGVCVNTNTDIDNCGGCGNACGANAACGGGTCYCPSPFIDCGGVCVNPQTDASNCGVCGNACASINGSGSCVSGGCVLTCDSGYANCDGNPATGCETHTDADPSNCGACAQSCGGGQSCAGGSCTTFGCAAGSTCESACPSNANCSCGTTITGDPTCHVDAHGCAGHMCSSDGDCTADYGAGAACIYGYCSTPNLLCLSDADCGPGNTCVNLNGGCGGCDNYTGGTHGICQPLCAA